MNITYAKKASAVQKADNSKAASVLDSSSQSESLQRKADMTNNAAQRAEAPRPNNTGMPDNLKSGIESLSGFSMDDVHVHYNSSKPATVQALAYTQGTDIHVAPGQEKHLPHEAWHVAQQMAGRVSPTTNINGMPVNDNATLEHEADVMGEKAVQCKYDYNLRKHSSLKKVNCIQMFVISGSPDFAENHLVTKEDYEKDENTTTLKTRIPFNNISTKMLKENYEALKEKTQKSDLPILQFLLRAVKGVLPSKKGTYENKKLNDAFDEIMKKTTACKKAKKRGQYNSITCKEKLKDSGSAYNRNSFKIDSVDAISCDLTGKSIKAKLPALYKKKENGGDEEHEFYHLGPLSKTTPKKHP